MKKAKTNYQSKTTADWKEAASWKRADNDSTWITPQERELNQRAKQRLTQTFWKNIPWDSKDGKPKGQVYCEVVRLVLPKLWADKKVVLLAATTKAKIISELSQYIKGALDLASKADKDKSSKLYFQVLHDHVDVNVMDTVGERQPKQKIKLLGGIVSSNGSSIQDLNRYSRQKVATNDVMAVTDQDREERLVTY